MCFLAIPSITMLTTGYVGRHRKNGMPGHTAADMPLQGMHESAMTSDRKRHQILPEVCGLYPRADTTIFPTLADSTKHKVQWEGMSFKLRISGYSDLVLRHNVMGILGCIVQNIAHHRSYMLQRLGVYMMLRLFSTSCSAHLVLKHRRHSR